MTTQTFKLVSFIDFETQKIPKDTKEPKYKRNSTHLSLSILRKYEDGTYNLYCFTIWSDDFAVHRRYELIYTCILFALEYLIPLVLMAAAYSRIGEKYGI